MRLAKGALTVLSAAAVACGFPAPARTQVVALPPIGDVVAALVTPAVPVTCEPNLAIERHQSGTVEWEPHPPLVATRIVLDAAICADYQSQRTSEAASALLIVLHESMHAALHSVDEAEVECHALRLMWSFTVPVFARELGDDAAARAVARLLADRYYAVALVVDAGMPAWYHLAPGEPCSPAG
jgi:hypothetical protein